MTSADSDGLTFAQFEHLGWQNVGEHYDDYFGSLTGQSIEPLLDAARVHAGDALLDVATGPGYIAAAAARRGARATGLDFSAAMLAKAAALHPQLALREGDAGDLPFADGSFDVVVIGFGILHFPDPDRALHEACRVLRRGGRLALSVWAGADKAVGFGVVLRAVERHGKADAKLPGGPPFFRFSDRAECGKAIAAAGFGAPEFREIAQTWRFPSAAAFFDGVSASTVRTAALLRAQAPDALARIRAAVESEVARYAAADGSIALPMPALIACAAKP